MIPKIKKKLSSFIKSEEGRMSTQSMLTLGAFTAAASLGVAVAAKEFAGEATASGEIESIDHSNHANHSSQPVSHSSQPNEGADHQGELFTLDKGWVKIKSIEYKEGPVQTHNLEEVDGENTFFAEKVLAHNKGEPEFECVPEPECGSEVGWECGTGGECPDPNAETGYECGTGGECGDPNAETGYECG